MNPLTVSAIQLASLEGLDLAEALEVVDTAVASAAAAGTDLAILPEIWSPGYFAFDDYGAAAAHAPDVRRQLAGLASRHGIHLHGGSFVEGRNGKLHNTSVLFDPTGTAIAEYSKIHLFGFGSREPEVLTPGGSVTVVDTAIGRLGMVVCYDLRYPELFRQMVDAGAEMVLVASAWPYPRLEAWQTLVKARAIEGQIHVVAVNGVGPTASGPSLCGHSLVVDPWGVPLASAGDEAAVITTTIDRDAVPDARRRLRQLADRRILAPSAPRLSFRRPGERPLVMEVSKLDITGYTGRDIEAVKQYVAKLEAEGIAAPPRVPMVFDVGVDRIVSHDNIEVTGAESCGEVEFVLLVAEDGIHVTVGSDHTDRALETKSIPLSKQVVPKIVATEAWRLEEVIDHWDQLELSSFVGVERRPYQRMGVDFFLPPDQILALSEAAVGTVIFGGSASSLDGGFDFDPVFSGTLHDPVLDRSIQFTYRSRTLEGT